VIEKKINKLCPDCKKAYLKKFSDEGLSCGCGYKEKKGEMIKNESF